MASKSGQKFNIANICNQKMRMEKLEGRYKSLKMVCMNTTDWSERYCQR